MRASVLLLALFATACTGLTPVAPNPGPFQFSGTISRTGGSVTAIAGADLTVTEGVNKNARATSDSTGRYVFAALDAGRFTLTITAPGYVTITPVVDLHEDTSVTFALKPQ
jgi:hypothetical protein